MTDGCVQSNKNIAEITSIDKDWIFSINQEISPNKPIRFIRNKYYRAEYFSKEICDWLKSSGCIPRKSLTLKFPDIPKKYLPDFIRGCWDGDGHLSIKEYKTAKYSRRMNRHVSIGSGSCDFIQGMSVALNKLGINNYVECRKLNPRKIGNTIIDTNNLFYQINITKADNMVKFATLIYDNKKLSLTRKKNTALAIIAEWHKIFYCQKCGVVISNISKPRINKYCPQCKILQRKETQKQYDRLRRPKINA